jgi:hypothetical protein
MYKNLLAAWVLLLCTCILNTETAAQTTWDEVMMGKGQACFALIYEHASWDKYWEGSYLRTNANIGTLTRTTFQPMLAFGISDRVNFLTGLPYVRTAASGGTQQGQQGIQDLNLALKVKWIQADLGSGQFRLLTNTAFNIPVGNYLSDYMPFSIGSKAPEIGMRAIGSYRSGKGWTARTSLAYLWRGQSEVERNFYYHNGGVYSSWMDVPNALNFQGTVGKWFGSQFRIEATYTSLKCLTGDDIRAYNAPQPTNKVEVSTVGAWAQYYIKGQQGLGAIAYFNQTIKGRNMGQFTAFGMGLTYQMPVF